MGVSESFGNFDAPFANLGDLAMSSNQELGVTLRPLAQANGSPGVNFDSNLESLKQQITILQMQMPQNAWVPPPPISLPERPVAIMKRKILAKLGESVIPLIFWAGKWLKENGWTRPPPPEHRELGTGKRFPGTPISKRSLA